MSRQEWMERLGALAQEALTDGQKAIAGVLMAIDSSLTTGVEDELAAHVLPFAEEQLRREVARIIGN